MSKIMIDCNTNSLDEFRKLAEFAKKADATHVNISQVETAMWQWDLDRTDPYPNWGMSNATLFKVALPGVLEKYIPAAYPARNLEMFSKRAEILKEYGLKAMFVGMEPAWLPNEVYRDHPSWRGPRCDQPRRARNEYYAPCTDNPEVQALYKESMKKLCSVIPVEYFEFLTNDSGGGVCWAGLLYPGANGPTSCRHTSMGDKVTNFLTVLQDAAASVGVKAEVGYRKQFTAEEMSSIVPKLKEGQFCQGKYKDSSFSTKLIGLPDWQDCSYSINGLYPIVGVAEQMADACNDPNCNINYLIKDMNQKEVMQLIIDNSKTIENSTMGKYKALYKTAVSIIGEKYADKLVDMWEYTQKVYDRMGFWNVGGHVSELGTVHQRWLTRPLVAFESELSDEEKSYYRPFLFQAGTEEDAQNLVNMQATIWLGGESARINFRNCSRLAILDIKSAVDIIDELLTKDDIGDYKEDLKEHKLRLRLLAYTFRNQKNVITFQSIMDRTDKTEVATDKTIVIDEQGDKRFYKVMAILREEIDNTYEIIKILDEAKTNILNCTPTEEQETIMRFGPDIKNDLLKKVDIMERHKLEFERLFKSYNK